MKVNKAQLIHFEDGLLRLSNYSLNMENYLAYAICGANLTSVLQFSRNETRVTCEKCINILSKRES